MVRIRLDESQLNKLFEYQSQRRLPVRDEQGGNDYEYSEKNAMENYLDWIEQFGKVGTLGRSSIDFIGGLKSGFDKAFEWYSENNGKYVSYVGDDEEMLDEKNFELSLLKKRFYKDLGKEGFYVLLPSGGYEIRSRV